MVVLPVNPTAGFCSTSLKPALFSVISRTTGCVCPLMVRSPVTLAVRSPVGSTAVETKVTSPWSVPKKSPDARCASRSGEMVRIVFSGKLAVTVDFDGSAGSSVTSPVIWFTTPKLVE